MANHRRDSLLDIMASMSPIMAELHQTLRNLPSDKDFTIRLVEAVRKRPILYESDTPGYKDRHLVKAEWAEIAHELGCTEETAKLRWHNLRGSYSRSKSRRSGFKKSCFYLADHMSFLDPYMMPDVSVASSSSIDKEVIWDTPTLTPSSPPVSSSSPAQTSSSKPISIGQFGPDKPVIQQTAATATSLVRNNHMQKHSEDSNMFDNESSQSVMENVEPDGLEHNSLTYVVHPLTENGPVDFQTIRNIKRRLSENFESESGQSCTKRFQSEYRKPNSESMSDYDLDSLRGLLPHMAQLKPKNKRMFVRNVYNLVFNMLDDQDEECS